LVLVLATGDADLSAHELQGMPLLTAQKALKALIGEFGIGYGDLPRSCSGVARYH